MTGKGVIVRTNGPVATVRLRKSSACGHDCGECRVCSNPEIEVEILNPISAKVGDIVAIGMDSSKVLMWAFMLYILPILGAMIFCAISMAAFGSRLVSALITAIWATVWFVSIRRYSKDKVSMSSALEVIYEEN